MRKAEIEAKRLARCLKYGIPAFAHRAIEKSATPILSYSGSGYQLKEFINEYVSSNANYGISHVLRKWASYSKPIAATVEHGLYFVKGVPDDEIERYDMPAVITFGDERKKEIRTTTDRPIFTVGPYIAYADRSVTEPCFSEMKERLGRVLLVFPSHSNSAVSLSYEQKDFCNYIHGFIKDKGFDTVLVSLYYRDIGKYASLYEAEGFKVVCSGHWSSLDFMSRQRTYIELSDHVLTNGSGTHIGYAVYFNKPVTYHRQEIECLASSEASRAVWSGLVDYVDNIARIPEMFSSEKSIVSSEQRKFVDKYWGVSHVKTPDELRCILDVCRMTYIRSKKHRMSYRDSYEDILSELKDPNVLTLLSEAIEGE